MIKYFQNRIAESGLLLPLAAVITLGVWLLSGLVEHAWWGQLVCFVVTTYLLVELSNSNALLRVRSRMVSSTFLALSCASCPLLGSLPGGIVQLCTAAATIILFRTYQDKEAPGWNFYAFLCIGLSSLVFVQTLYFVPLVWLLMASHLQSLSWRSWIASLIGLLTPYWFAMLYFLYIQDFTPVVAHFSQLTQLPFPGSSLYNIHFSLISFYVLVLVLAITSAVHFWYRSFEDKIRIRQLFGYFIAMSFFVLLMLALQPQHSDMLMRMLLVFVSPLIAHFFTTTSSKLTNVFFIVTLVLVSLLTVFYLISPFLDIIPFPLTPSHFSLFPFPSFSLWSGL